MKCFLRLSSLAAMFLFLGEGILPAVFHDSLPAAEAAQCAFAGTVDDANPCDAGLSAEVKTNLGENAVTTCSAIEFKSGAGASNITGAIESGFCPATPPVPALSFPDFPTPPVFPPAGGGDGDKDKDKDKDKDDDSSCPVGWPVFDFATHTDANGFLVGSSPFQFCKMELKQSQIVQTAAGNVVWVFKKLKLKNNSQLIINGGATFNVREDFQLENKTQMAVNGPTTFNVLGKMEFKNEAKIPVNGDTTFNVWKEFKLENESLLTLNGTMMFNVLKKMEFKNNVNVPVNGWLTAWLYDKFEMENKSVLSITGDASINVKKEAKLKNDAAIQLLDGTLTLWTDDMFKMENKAAINQTKGRPSEVLVLAGKSSGESAELKNSALLVGALATNGKVELENTAGVIGSVLGGSMKMKNSATVDFRTGAGSDTKGFSCEVLVNADPGDVDPGDIDPDGFTFGSIGSSGCSVSIPCVSTSIDRLKIIYHREFLGTFASCDPSLPAGDPKGCDSVRNNPEGNGTISIPDVFLSQGVAGTNMKVAALGAGPTACTINIGEAPWDNADCGYRVAVARTGTMLRIDTKPRNGALNCLMKFDVLAPAAFHIEEETDESETEEAVINENSLVDDVLAGFVGNRGHAVLLGMKGNVKVRTTSGNVFADLTSNNVRMKSLTGDLWARGLTQKGYFRSWGGGNLRIDYCQTPPDTSDKDLTVFARRGVVSTTAGDTDISFPTVSVDSVFESLIAVEDPGNQFKNLLGNCPMCLFKVQGKAEGGVFIGGKTPQACKF